MFYEPNFANKKKVRFSPFIRTFPNPTIIEKERYQYLWWTELDKSAAYFMMFTEIRNLQKKHPTMTVKQAMKLLYQPDNLTRYDPNNFII
jgi:regulatory protein YycI of two-component signal transduction system YycFG